MKKTLILLMLCTILIFLSSCIKDEKSDELIKKYGTIYEAVRKADPPAVKAFLKQTPELVNKVEETNEWLYPPLTLAIECKSKSPEKSKELQEIIEILVSKGADVNVRVKYNETPLTLAAAKGQKETAELLLKEGADLNAAGTPGWTPLHQAVLNNHSELVEFFISKGAKIDTHDSNGDTPLHSAAGWGYKNIAEILLKNGADVNAIDKYDKTPLDYALMKENKEMQNLLKAHGGKAKTGKAPIKQIKPN
ncbi:MAG: ankyrin repeat domain-containing protein [Candidatus Xenobiia bacterium LiM19]